MDRRNLTPTNNPSQQVPLYDVLKAGYDKTKRNDLNKYGYNYDSMLSNSNQQVYFNPNENKLLVNVAGTHNWADVGTDLYLAFGDLKSTNRYKQARDTLNKAKEKYGVQNATITGDSLGGAVSQYIASKDDKAITYNKGTTIGQKTRGNENAFRVEGDVVSLLSSGAKRSKTLDNKAKTTFNPITNILNRHYVDNLKGRDIFI